MTVTLASEKTHELPARPTGWFQQIIPQLNRCLFVCLYLLCLILIGLASWQQDLWVLACILICAAISLTDRRVCAFLLGLWVLMLGKAPSYYQIIQPELPFYIILGSLLWPVFLSTIRLSPRTQQNAQSHALEPIRRSRQWALLSLQLFSLYVLARAYPQLEAWLAFTDGSGFASGMTYLYQQNASSPFLGLREAMLWLAASLIANTMFYFPETTKAFLAGVCLTAPILLIGAIIQLFPQIFFQPLCGQFPLCDMLLARPNSWKLTSFMGNSTWLGQLMAVAAPFFLLSALQPTIKRWHRLMVALMGIACCAVILLTIQRATVLALCVSLSLGVLGWHRTNRRRSNVSHSPAFRKKHLLILAGFLLLLVIPTSLVFQDYVVKLQKGIPARLHLWGTVIGMIQDAPLWGTGSGTFQKASVLHQQSQGISTPLHFQTAHQTLLHLFAELGIVGVILFTSWIAACCASAFRSRQQNWQAKSVLLGLTALGIISLFHYLSHNYAVHFTFVILACSGYGLLQQLKTTEKTAAQPFHVQHHRHFAMLLCLLTIGSRAVYPEQRSQSALASGCYLPESLTHGTFRWCQKKSTHTFPHVTGNLSLRGFVHMPQTIAVTAEADGATIFTHQVVTTKTSKAFDLSIPVAGLHDVTVTLQGHRHYDSGDNRHLGLALRQN